jgi:hypothetical protein
MGQGSIAGPFLDLLDHSSEISCTFWEEYDGSLRASEAQKPGSGIKVEKNEAWKSLAFLVGKSSLERTFGAFKMNISCRDWCPVPDTAQAASLNPNLGRCPDAAQSTLTECLLWARPTARMEGESSQRAAALRWQHSRRGHGASQRKQAGGAGATTS